MEDEIKELTATHCEDQWMLQGLLARVEAMEASQELMRARLEVVNPALVFVDLTQEEDEGGLGGPILVAETLTASIDTAGEQERVQVELVEELNHLLAHMSRADKVMVNGEYTPTGPSTWGLEF